MTDRIAFKSAGAVRKNRTKHKPSSLIDIDALTVDFIHNVAGLDDGWLDGAPIDVLRDLVREYRAQAWAIIRHVDARD
jgi:hypothetical protein